MGYEPHQDEVDRILVPVEITSGNQTIEVAEEDSDGATQVFSIQVPTGTYFAFHRFGANHSSPVATGGSVTWKTGFDSLWRDVCNRLNSNTFGGGEYHVEWASPTQSSFPYRSTVRLYYTSLGLNYFQINAGNSMFPLELFGFNPNDPQNPSPIRSSGSPPQLTGRVTADGFWTSPRLASFKRSFEIDEKEITEVDFDTITSANWKEWIVRRLKYDRVEGIHAVESRERKPKFSDIGDLYWWDKYNAFERYYHQIDDGQKFLAFYGSPWGDQSRPDGTTVDWPNANADIEVADGNVSASNVVRSTVEIDRMYDQAEMNDFREVGPTDENSSSEHYPIEFKLRVDPNQQWDY